MVRLMLREIGRPLWRLLLVMTNQEDGNSLNCDECFLVLEYLAEMRANEGTDFRKFSELFKKHLASCLDCREYYLQQLQNLEALYQTRS